MTNEEKIEALQKQIDMLQKELLPIPDEDSAYYPAVLEYNQFREDMIQTLLNEMAMLLEE